MAELDPHVRAAIPDLDKVLAAVPYGEASAWATFLRLRVRHIDKGESDYFMKVSVGHHGREALKGEFESTASISAMMPGFCPKPLGWGTFKNSPNSHFYLCKFYHFAGADTMPPPEQFCKNLARLHSMAAAPSPNDGKFGFHCTTYNGDMPQDNTWSDSWEAFFASGLRHVLRIREERAGPDEVLDALLPALFDKVIPRLLRPLETHGRRVKPALVHGDLWYGNTAVIEGVGKGIIFDPSSFWAHNEYELGNWHPDRNRFTREYFDAYSKYMPKSEPVEDFDDRNALYSLRFNLQAATLFYHDGEYLKMAKDEIKRLVQKFPDGYIE